MICYNTWLQRHHAIESHNAMTNNPNCDGSGPHSGDEVRVLPAGTGNAILCRSCYEDEMAFRRERNSPNARPPLAPGDRYELPAWESLKVYAP